MFVYSFIKLILIMKFLKIGLLGSLAKKGLQVSSMKINPALVGIQNNKIITPFIYGSFISIGLNNYNLMEIGLYCLPIMTSSAFIASLYCYQKWSNKISSKVAEEAQQQRGQILVNFLGKLFIGLIISLFTVCICKNSAILFINYIPAYLLLKMIIKLIRDRRQIEKRPNLAIAYYFMISSFFIIYAGYRIVCSKYLFRKLYASEVRDQQI